MAITKADTIGYTTTTLPHNGRPSRDLHLALSEYEILLDQLPFENLEELNLKALTQKIEAIGLQAGHSQKKIDHDIGVAKERRRDRQETIARLSSKQTSALVSVGDLHKSQPQ